MNIRCLLYSDLIINEMELQSVLQHLLVFKELKMLRFANQLLVVIGLQFEKVVAVVWGLDNHTLRRLCHCHSNRQMHGVCDRCNTSLKTSCSGIHYQQRQTPIEQPSTIEDLIWWTLRALLSSFCVFQESM